jgi:hypothetical protein
MLETGISCSPRRAPEAAVTALLLATLALARPVPTEAELAALSRREIVLRTPPPRTPGAHRVEAFLDVRAAPARAFAALMDAEARVRGSSVLKGYEVYRRDPVRPCMRWYGSRLGFSLNVHTCYVVDESRWQLDFALDPTRPSDITTNVGGYTMEPVAGGTRVTFEAETAFGGSLPGFLQQWLTTQGARDYLTGLRARAEAP